MKLFLSDLHLSDGKERDDFQYHKEFEDLVTKLSEEFGKVEIIFLGDIFDLIRTQKYYEFEVDTFTEDRIREIKREENKGRGTRQKRGRAPGKARTR